MEARRKLDAAGRTGLIARILITGMAMGCAQAQSADALLDRGLDLAGQQRWDEARSAFSQGQQAYPGDARFPVELGGVAFQQRRSREAARWLRRGLALNPSDSYAADFLATIYFLEGNTEAALKYWNRAGKPVVAGVSLPEQLKLDPVLLDRAFTFAPGDRLQLGAWRETQARVAGLEVFPRFQLRLNAQEDGRVTGSLTAVERNGFGSGKMDALLTAFRGVGYRAVRGEYGNIGGGARNVDTLFRWDPNKRRVSASYTAPLRGNPARRVRIGLDAREERWALREGSAPVLGSLGLRRAALSAAVRSAGDGTWSWGVGAEGSHRTYRDVTSWNSASAEVLRKGFQLKQTSTVTRALWRAPEHRFESRATASGELGRLWSDGSHAFGKVQTGAAMLWFPKMRGDDYAVRASVRAGRMFGTVPFDELAIVGLERDSDLPLRAHIGTREGRKGSAPMGLHYVVTNFEIDKTVYNAGLWSVALSPFFDSGRVDDSIGLGRNRWLFDVGVQLKLRVLGVGFTFAYGKDLRTGANTFYAFDSVRAGLPGPY